MKKLTILSAIALSGLIFNTANAQIRVSVGLHLGVRPVAYVPAPVVVEQTPVYDQDDQAYDDGNDDDYYYLPDVDAYYNVTAQLYYYNNGDSWISCAYLPGAYHNYDWRSGRRFEVREHRPYMHNDIYRSRHSGHEVAEWKNYNRQNNYGRGTERRDNFNHDANRGNDNHFQNKGGFGQPSNQGHKQNRDNGNNGNSAQPSNRNESGHDRGADNHFAHNNQPMVTAHRGARF